MTSRGFIGDLLIRASKPRLQRSKPARRDYILKPVEPRRLAAHVKALRGRPQTA